MINRINYWNLILILGRANYVKMASHTCTNNPYSTRILKCYDMAFAIAIGKPWQIGTITVPPFFKINFTFTEQNIFDIRQSKTKWFLYSQQMLRDVTNIFHWRIRHYQAIQWRPVSVGIAQLTCLLYYAQQLVDADIKGNIKAPHYWPFVRETTGNHAKDQ